jgi:tetratricopeptide (TPR) repeat protein
MQPVAMPLSFYSRTITTIALLSAYCSFLYAQTQVGHQPSAPVENPPPAESRESANYLDQQAEQELQRGTALTRSGHFTEAIPHLLTAHGRVSNEYAASMNLAICYIATDQPKRAIPILDDLRSSGHDTADVNNLLAQAYIGNSQSQQGFAALQRAASISPTNEKLYMFVADACMGRQAYALGMQVVQLGLKNLPQSGRLHFERAMFLSLLDRFDEAKPDFALARSLAPGSDIAYLASAQQAMLDGNVPETIRVAREGIKRGDEGFLLLTLLGEALLRSGVAPGQPEFEEARTALEKSVAERANYPSSQLSLGKLYLMDNRAMDAMTHLEIARQLNPNNPAVYSNLAVAYRKQGDLLKAQEALETLQELNSAQAEKIRTAPGESKANYATSGSSAQPH